MRPGSTTPHHPNLLLTHSPTCSHGCRYQPRPTHSTHAPVERPTPRDLPSLRFSLRSPRDLLARPAAGLLPVSRPPHRPSFTPGRRAPPRLCSSPPSLNEEDLVPLSLPASQLPEFAAPQFGLEPIELAARPTSPSALLAVPAVGPETW